MMTIFLLLLMAVAPITIMPEGDASFFMSNEVTVRFRMTIPLHEDNRYAILEWDSEDGGAGTSYVYFSGNEERITYRFAIRLNPGHYTFRGVLVRANGDWFLSERRQITVIATVPH
jgi:hypothetical protein